jgi:NADH:ubiquinone oxidoreductase subunit 5 (subunit L)/multisubunit Na+/H+ antiporter MnhA subunit
MTFSTTWLLALALCGPLVGVSLGLVLAAGARPLTVAAVSSVRAGVLMGLLAAIGMACVTRGLFGSDSLIASGSEIIVWNWGAWLEVGGPRPVKIDWTWQADSLTAVWLVLLAGLSWLILSRFEDADEKSSQLTFTLTAGMVHVAAVAFVLSTNLVQMLFFWGAIAMASMLMAGWSSHRRESSDSIRAMIRTGLLTDGLLLLAVLLIGRQCGSYSVTEVFSADGLTRLAHENPALPGFVGCLLVLGVLGRCGTFPCFGWHRSVPAWSGQSNAMIYAVGYVPSAIWMLLRCQPLLAGSESSLALLGGLGTLGAVLSSFVACGMDDPRRAIAFVLTSQVDVMLTALGSGAHEAGNLCVWHQCGLSVAAFVLLTFPAFQTDRHRARRAVVWCAALSVVGVFPLTGGWSHRALLGLHALPATSISTPSEEVRARKTGDTSSMDNVDSTNGGSIASPRWNWLYGLWIAQGLSAFAIVRAVSRSTGPNALQEPDEGSRIEVSPKPDIRFLVVGAALLTGGLLGQTFGVPHGIPAPDDVARLVIGQSAALLGLIAACQGAGPSTGSAIATSQWAPIARLCRECLYIDRVFAIAFYAPAWCVRCVSEFIEAMLTERLFRAVAIRLPAWLGMQLETVHIGRVEFSLASMLLGTAALLLTLFLIS